ncbi:MAG: TatD family hydrolase [Bacilli bacterium]
MYTDTHFHIDSNDCSTWNRIIERSELAGVNNLVVSGCDQVGISNALVFSQDKKNLFVTIGFHPEYANQIRESDLVSLEENLQNKKVVGIGEIGLDYHYGKENKEKQKWLFERQLELAIKYNKVVVIHTRDAIQDTYDILKKYPVRGVIHCFSESLEMAELFIKLGFLLGIGGVLTFKNSGLVKVVEHISLENILLETDSPYLCPEPYRGDINGPWNIPYIAKKIAEIKKVDINEVALVTTDNAKRLFDLSIKL